MGSRYTVIDIAGDILLIATSTTEPFAPWGDSGVQTQVPSKPQEFKARVSSAVLRLASPVFQREFHPIGPWKLDIKPDGLRHKHISGFDNQALEHVLNILHLRNGLVPKNLPAEDAAKIAVIAHHLDCCDAVSFAAQSWLMECNGLREQQFSRPLVLWLFVASVFQHTRVFQMTAKTAMENGTGPFNTLNLPFVKPVITLLDEGRQQMIESLLAALDRFRGVAPGRIACTLNCDFWHASLILKSMVAAKLHPKPVQPFVGISVCGIYSMLADFETKAVDSPFLGDCYKNRNYLWKQSNRGACKTKQISHILEMMKRPFDHT